MHARAALSLSLLALGCHRDPDCHALTYDPATHSCICPEGTEWSTTASRCEDVSDAGGSTDAAPDSATISVPLTIVAQRVSRPAPGLSVVFHDADGNALESATTDATGTAQSSVPGAEGATLVDTEVGSIEIYSVLDVAPHETITFDLLPIGGAERTVTLPGPFAGAVAYSVRSPAFQQSGTDPAQPWLALDYMGTGTHVVALALDDAARPIAFSFADVFVDMPDVTLPAWTAPATVLVNVAGVLGDVAVDARASVAGAAFVPLDVTFDPVGVLRVPPFGEATVFRAISEDRSIEQRVATDMLDMPFETDLARAPRVTALTGDRTDPEHPTLSWSAAVEDPSAAIAALSYIRDSSQVTWRVFTDPRRTRISVPTLPDALESIRPTPEAPEYSVTIVDGGPSLSWAAFRSHPTADPIQHWAARTSRIARGTVSATF